MSWPQLYEVYDTFQTLSRLLAEGLIHASIRAIKNPTDKIQASATVVKTRPSLMTTYTSISSSMIPATTRRGENLYLLIIARKAKYTFSYLLYCAVRQRLCDKDCTTYYHSITPKKAIPDT